MISKIDTALFFTVPHRYAELLQNWKGGLVGNAVRTRFQDSVVLPCPKGVSQKFEKINKFILRSISSTR